MNWHSKIFAYCERGSDPSFWAEPVNALTNLAFILASFVAFIVWLRLPDRATRRAEFLLIALVFIIGVGSFLFHTYATRWAALADVFPITVFMIAYFAFALVRFARFKSWQAVLGALVFAGALPVAGMLGARGGFFAGSASYVPALVALFGIAYLLRLKNHSAASRIGLAGFVFLVSLTLRTLDLPICGATGLITSAPLGTHFFWHLLNALVLYLLLSAALSTSRRADE